VKKLKGSETSLPTTFVSFNTWSTELRSNHLGHWGVQPVKISLMTIQALPIQIDASLSCRKQTVDQNANLLLVYISPDFCCGLK
jgi:hypothetical protein